MPSGLEPAVELRLGKKRAGRLEDLVRSPQFLHFALQGLEPFALALQDEQKSSRQLAQRIEALQAAERRADVLQAQVQGLQEQLTAAAAKVEGLTGQVREHEPVAAAAHAKLAAQEGMAAELRGYLANPPAGGE